MKKVTVLILVISCLSFAICWIPRNTSDEDFEDDDKNLAIPVYHDDDVDPGEPLFLTPLIKAGKIGEARKASNVTIGRFPYIRSYSGFLTVNPLFDSNLFFWFFEAEVFYETAPVILWLQDGLRETSLFGQFIENGPIKIKKGGTTEVRKRRWSRKYSVLYIDSLVGSGFSFTKGGYSKNQAEISGNLYEALQQFFTMFPDLQKNEFYIAGEAYGGKHVPSLAYEIHKHNPTANLKIYLEGIAIGSGFTDPINQFDYASYLFEIGLIDSGMKRTLEVQQASLVANIEKKEFRTAYKIREEIVDAFVKYSGIRNVFNYLVETSTEKKLEKLFSSYIQSNSIRQALHVGKIPYDIPKEVRNNLIEDVMKSVAPLVSELLKHYRVLIYNGQTDIIMGYPLVLKYLENLHFEEAYIYRNSTRKLWYVNKELAGYVKTAGNLVEVLVREAGHFAQFNQAQWCFDMFTKFFGNLPIA